MTVYKQTNIYFSPTTTRNVEANTNNHRKYKLFIRSVSLARGRIFIRFRACCAHFEQRHAPLFCVIYYANKINAQHCATAARSYEGFAVCDCASSKGLFIKSSAEVTPFPSFRIARKLSNAKLNRRNSRFGSLVFVNAYIYSSFTRFR